MEGLVRGEGKREAVAWIALDLMGGVGGRFVKVRMGWMVY